MVILNELKRILKITFCRHKELKYEYTLYGDAINHYPGRYIHKCQRCGGMICTNEKFGS